MVEWHSSNFLCIRRSKLIFFSLHKQQQIVSKYQTLKTTNDSNPPNCSLYFYTATCFVLLSGLEAFFGISYIIGNGVVSLPGTHPSVTDQWEPGPAEKKRNCIVRGYFTPPIHRKLKLMHYAWGSERGLERISDDIAQGSQKHTRLRKKAVFLQLWNE